MRAAPGGAWCCCCCCCLWLLLAAGACQPGGYRRKVSLEYNPGLNSSAVNLLHIRAVGRNDTLHYVWSTLGAPTALLVYTNSETSTLRVNWTRLLSSSPAGAIRVEPATSVLYSTGIVFARVFEYNGTNTSDLSRVSAGGFYPTYDLANFTWDSLGGKVNGTGRTVTFRGVSREPGGAFWNGSISFKVTAFEESSRDGPLPRLLHTANASKVEFVMHRVAPRGNSSRFALEVVAVEGGGRQKRLESLRSIDDEYTPTVFEMAQLVSVPINQSSGSSFLQWKTAAYSALAPKRDDTVHCQYYQLQTANCTLPSTSIARAYFGEGLERDTALAAINISFGSEDKEAYEETGYLSWSALLGFGEPPEDTFSPLVIAILAVALGAPVVLLAVGTVVVLARRKKPQSEYEPIN